MDRSSLFSAISFVAVIIYMYIGVYTFRQNTKSIIHRTFLCLCTSYAIWSFAYAFAYVSKDRYVFSFYNKIAAIGWCTFSAISLCLVLLITDNKFMKKKWFIVLICSPAFIFLYMAEFLFGVDINIPILISDFFYIGNFLYNFSYLLISIIALFLWGYKCNSKRIEKQSNILVVSSLIPFALNLTTQDIFPMIGIKNFPLMGQIYSLIMIVGTYFVITKYKFLRLPERFIFEEISNQMIDMVLILNEKGEIIKISKHTLDLLMFDEKELLYKNIDYLFNKNNTEKIDIEDMKENGKKYIDINLLKKDGETIPVNISCIPVFDKVIHDFLGVAIVMQDISILHELKEKNEELREKSIRDSLTKLYNHQYSVEIIKEEICKSMENTNIEKLSLMMLDIDYFKRVNDVYGHQFGDYALETISNILINNINNIGHVGRFGGEEFIIILPKTDIEKANIIGEKIRREIEEYNFDKGLKLTMSIGIKQYSGESSVELVKNADDLLYKAKQNGRNRVEC